MSAPGRPRDAALDARVLSAALEELKSAGPDRFSLRAVARRAGVSRASLDRRWNSADDLVVAALQQAAPIVETPDVGSFEDQVHAAARALARSMAPPGLELQMRIAADGLAKPDALHRFQREMLNPGLAQVAAVFVRARDRGELADEMDPVLLADALAGAVFMRTMAHPRLLPPRGAALEAIGAAIIAASQNRQSL